ncbi:transposase family protein [Streptomyces sp. Ru72]|uniref:transposase family protein n=1 Tax=Streptomyces sp. Ru72 TaxID=2080747 RepID=UPI0035BE89B0
MDLPSRTLRFLTGQLAAPWKEIGTRWRRLPAGRQALLALAHLRCGDTYAQLAAGFGIGIATAFRYIREAIEVLSALAPTLTEAMEAIRAKAFVILDGTLLPIDRIAADTPYYSGKHKRHGMNVQVLTDPFGRLLWASPALPGSTHDLTAARQHGIIAALTESDLKCWADRAYQDAGGPVRVPFRGRRLKNWKRLHNSNLTAERLRHLQDAFPKAAADSRARTDYYAEQDDADPAHPVQKDDQQAHRPHEPGPHQGQEAGH